MSKKILIVDDSSTMRMSVSTTLTMAGFTVATASDGVQAISLLKGGLKPDLIITDINMPNMGGIDLIKNVRTMAGLRFTPILTLTTEGQSSMRDEAKKLGATGWLMKPILGPKLIEVIKQVLPGA